MDNCGKCKSKIKEGENILNCSGKCKHNYHAKCVNISTKEIQLIENCTGIKWFCEDCFVSVNTTIELHNIIANLKADLAVELEEIRNKINTVSENIPKYETKAEVKTYAKALTATANEVVIIKPKNKQESKKTKDAVLKNINPSALEVGITQLKDIKEGGVIIKCKNKEEQEKIKKAAEKKLNKQYQIRTPELKNPCIKILDIEENIGEEELINCIKRQNTFLNQEEIYLKVRVIKQMRKKFMAILECDPLTFKNIINEKYLFINWDTCRVFEYVGIFRCFKCGGYNHNAENCNRKSRCLKCAEEGHETGDCESDSVKCLNCLEAKSNLKLDIDIHHSVYDSNCPVYLRKINIQQQKIKKVSSE